MKICSVENCNIKVHAKTLCKRHYWQQYSKGSLFEIDRTVFDPNEIEICENNALLYLYNRKGKITAKSIIDLDDVDRVKGFKWGLHAKGYVCNRDIGMLHHFIMGYTGNQYDHIDLNKLNNSKQNLRICSTFENARNKDISKRNKSGVKGVYWSKKALKWISQITVNYKVIYLGCFNSLQDASEAYRLASEKYHKEFGRVCDTIGGGRANATNRRSKPNREGNNL